MSTIVERITAVIAAAEDIPESNVKEEEPAWWDANARTFSGPSLEIMAYRGHAAVSARLAHPKRFTVKATVPVRSTSVAALENVVRIARRNVETLARAYDALERAGYTVTPGTGSSPYPDSGLTIRGDELLAWIHTDGLAGTFYVTGQRDERGAYGRVYYDALDAIDL